MTAMEELHKYVENIMISYAQQLESDIANAIILQDYDRIDDLHTVWVSHEPMIPPAVASFIR